MRIDSILFRPASGNGAAAPAISWWFCFLVLVLLGLAAAAYATILLDHPFVISSNSRALYVDEGFYSDGAQNFVKFGRWGFPYDFPHWVGTPFLTLLQTLLFLVTGPTLEAARSLSVVLSVITALAFYAVARAGMGPFTAMLLTVSSVLTFNFAAHARSALADPTAVCVSMLALLVYVRVRPRSLAIPLSLAFALAAAFTKMYYVFSIAAIAAIWVVELLIIPALRREPVDRRALIVLVLSLAGMAAIFGGFLTVFDSSFSERYAIGEKKLPELDLQRLAESLAGSLHKLFYNTKTHVYLRLIPAAALLAAVLLLVPRLRRPFLTRLRLLTRADLAMAIWLAAGLLMIGILQIVKPHYQFFAILPLCFVGVTCLKVLSPAALRTAAMCAAPVVHLAFQWPYYDLWMERKDKTALLDASRQIVEIVHDRGQGPMIPVIGEYSAQLGLFSPRVFGLDFKWSPNYPICERLAHWQPRFHINVDWPARDAVDTKQWVEACGNIEAIEEIARYPFFRRRNDELVLSRIIYAD